MTPDNYEYYRYLESTYGEEVALNYKRVCSKSQQILNKKHKQAEKETQAIIKGSAPTEKLNYNGKSMSISAFSRLTGIPYHFCLRRFQWGFTAEQIIEASTTKRTLSTPKIKVFWEGEEVFLSDLCRRYKVDLSCVRTRLKYGWTLQRALFEPIARRSLLQG